MYIYTIYLYACDQIYIISNLFAILEFAFKALFAKKRERVYFSTNSEM